MASQSSPDTAKMSGLPLVFSSVEFASIYRKVGSWDFLVCSFRIMRFGFACYCMVLIWCLALECYYSALEMVSASGRAAKAMALNVEQACLYQRVLSLASPGLLVLVLLYRWR